jgi:phage-related tail protein
LDQKVANSLLRTIFEELLVQGYNKGTICSVTLGSNAVIQFDKLMEGVDLGLKPLTRIINGLGFELCLVPVKSNDVKMKNDIQKKWDDVSKNMKEDIINFINKNYKVRKPKEDSIKLNKETSEFIDNIYDFLMTEDDE